MKKTLTYTLAALGVALLSACQVASAITIDFASLEDANVSFQGGSFQFNNAPSGYSLGVTASTGVGDSVGNLGGISGVFSIGAISISGSTQSAPVSGSGTMSIFDGVNTLTGTVVWNTISTTGVGTTINVNGVLNLTSIVYGGTGSDLGVIAAAGIGYEVVTLQFVPAQTLTTLKGATTAQTTSFSGNITTPVPDGGLSLALLGFALAGVEGLRRRFNA